MLVNDLPAAMRLSIDVGHPHREVELLAVLIGAAHTLNAVTISEITVGNAVKVREFDGDRTIETVEEVLPIFAVGRGADILPRRDHIENDDGLVGCIYFHDRVDVFCLERGDKAILEGSDLGRRVGPGRGTK